MYKNNITGKVVFTVYYRENEACLYRESGSERISEKVNEYPRTSLGWSSSRAG